LIVVGLDRFRQVYERMGRLGRDKVLKAVAPLLNARSRHSDVVARYGAEEFAILMPGTNARRAEALAQRLRAAVEADRFLRLCEVTASFGVATFPDHGQTSEAILRVAESGMYLAKRSDGNCVKVASPSIAAGDAERVHEWLEAIVKGMFPAGDEPFTHYPHQFEQRKPLLDTITALAFAVEAKGPYMQGHCQTVSKLAAGMALQAGLPQEEIDNVRLAGLVHDIGKLHVPEHVLRKPTLLTAEEFEVMKGHSVWGAKMLEPLDVKAIERSVRHHHERYDGTGYPDGLAGDGIPLGARIVAVAESFHNMVSTLRYRTARTFKDALDELRRCSGTQFDPQIVTAFFALTEIACDHRVHQ
jgi:diguanylate cyclase (GGDEF)-like protein/putative nucleotidyltransferase with HDIG domain